MASSVRRSIARLSTPRAEDVGPTRAGEQRGWGPKHVAASGETAIPTVAARGLVRLQPDSTGLDVEPSCPNAHEAQTSTALLRTHNSSRGIDH